MKEDLIKILNFKLKQIKDNIENLNHLNSKMDDVNKELLYIQDAIGEFKGEEHGFDIYKFSNIDRETFNKLLMNLSDDVLTKFGTNSCNYDGLIYLINGINDGISLTLTQEQVDAINLFIDKLLEKEKEYQDIIESLNEEKQKLEIKDLEVLNDLENKYSLIIENIEDNRYVTEIDEVVEAINYSEIKDEKTFGILCYLLKYNSEIHEKSRFDSKTVNDEKEAEEEKIDLTKPFDLEENYEEEKEGQTTEVMEVDFEKNQDEINTFNELTDEVQSEDEKVIDNVQNEKVENNLEEEKIEFSDNEYNPILPSFDSEGYYNSDVSPFGIVENQPIDMILPNVELDLPTEDEDSELDVINIPVYESESNFVISQDDELPQEEVENDALKDEFVSDEINNVGEASDEFKIEKSENEITIEDNSLNISLPNANMEILNSSNELEIETNKVELDSSNSRQDENIVNELVTLFDSYGFDFEELDEITKNILQKGNLEEYKDIFFKLNELEILKYFKNNIDVLTQIILYSNTNIIDEINTLIDNNLLIDKTDKKYTMEIIIKTIPSIFIKGEKGNYDNFIKNIVLFKEYGIDLIALFYFSREVFAADSNLIVNNYNIVRNYDLTVNAYNAKYLLLLPNIGSKIDYYVEAMYKDNSENGNHEMFDGLEMIKLYPSKLNTVTSETIQRLRFSSENGLKIFGSKEKSLTGEITNLNVNIIDISEDYLKSLFNNEFDIIARDEVEKYIKLVATNDFVEMNEDELLNKLSGYKVGMRYFIGNIKVSVNKVIRNYNILINNDIDKKKALLFAICYNLVITKTEYERLKSFVNGLGGN